MPGRALDPMDNSRHNAWNIPGMYFMRIGDLERAVTIYSEMKEWLLLRQSENGRRYHKGTPYHNLGVARLGQQDFQEARRNILLAFIEDAISSEDPSGTPAYIALRQIFSVSNEFLGEVIGVARSAAPTDQMDPENTYSRILTILGRPTVPIPQQEVSYTLEVYEERIFSVDKGHLEDLLQHVELASTTQQKKTSLEDLSHTLFGSVQGWSVIPSTRTQTGEIDQIIRNENSGHPFLQSLGSHILVECKNWSVKVGSNQIRIFIDKIDEHRLTSGIMLVKTGITGRRRRDAVGRIVSKFQQYGTITMVLTKQDIERVIACENLIKILKEKAENVRFGRL